MVASLNTLAILAASLAVVSGQLRSLEKTRLTNTELQPPDQQDFLPGQYFDLRLEVHAPVNGSEAFNNGIPDEKFTVTIAKESGAAEDVAKFFKLDEPKIEKWTFKWYEDLYAEDAKQASVINVASKIYRRLALYEPGKYTVTLNYYDGQKTTAEWVVRHLATQKKAKNIILFIGDGMTTNMITAARLLGHKTINGKYQSNLQLDHFPVIGHQMSTVNAMGVYADSSPDIYDDPKVETIVELLKRIWGSAWGAVSTAFIADATPTALTAHTRSRSAYGPLIDQALNSVTNYTWTNHGGPDVYFGGGAEQFIAGSGSYQGKDYYEEFAKANYTVSWNKTALAAMPNEEKALGIFCRSNLPVWIDRNILPDNLKNLTNDPSGAKSAATDLPGLKDMTLKAIDVLHKRGGDKGFFLMSEAASIDKQMHTLDYDRALGDLLELDDTVRATVEHLKSIGELESTLILVTSDHGHGFDVFGGVDTQYLRDQKTDRERRKAVGVYQNSGLSNYQVEAPGVSYSTGPNFPVNWDPRYAIAAGFGANPDRRENYRLSPTPRTPATNSPGFSSADYFANGKETTDGFVVNGTLPTTEAQGVHSLTDVAVYAMGPCQDTFGGTYSNIDVFYKMANCLGLARPDAGEGEGGKP
ncbi:alkaline phosphatase [Apiospora saccharicola]|uniref:alkaline phosphatase n=1 Tax=Apiospora saccharicola TaxID=335842 RepID=A0ABR1TK89_9PEZI